MPSYSIKHVTKYTYASTVIDCTNQVMLYPISDLHLEVRKHQVVISHQPAVELFSDYFGNQVGVFSLIKPHTELLIESISEVVTKPIALPMDSRPSLEQWRYLQELKNQVAYIDFLSTPSFTALHEVKEELGTIFQYEATPFQNALAFTSYVYREFMYQKGVTNVETEPDEIWKLKAGVCQDFTHILIVFLRLFEIPARYVSGYICPKDKEMRGEGATHAWVEMYVPDYGWIGLDPTNNCIVNDQHVRLAIGRSFYDCTPVKGTYKGSGQHTLEVSVEITNDTETNTEKKPSLPLFSYEVKNPGQPINSYRHYLEIQQKQQQQ